MPQQALVITPMGELDVAAVRDLGPQLNEAAGQLDRPVVIDLTRVTFLDSTALGALVQADARLLRGGRRLHLAVRPGSAPAVTLDLTRIDQRLAVHPDREAALAAAFEDGRQRQAQ